MTDIGKAQEFLAWQDHMVVAVVLDDGTPWAVPVKIRAREGWNLEWDSRVDTVHSQAIEKRPDIAVTVYEKAEEAQTGVYMKGHASIVSRRDDGFARYQFTPMQVWINDETFVKREVPLA